MLISKKLLYTSVLLFATTSIKAQFSEGIASGRPGNANGGFSVGKGVYQVQAGYNFFSAELTDDILTTEIANLQQIQSTDAIFRIGLKEDFELRIAGNFILQDQLDYGNEVSDKRSGLERLAIGVRQTLHVQDGFWPTTALQFTVDFGGVDDYQKINPDAIFRINFSSRLGERFNLNYNASSRWRTDNSNIQGFFIASLGFRVSQKFSVTGEVFSVINNSTETLSGGMGFAYALNNNFQLDIYGSYGNRNYVDLPFEKQVFNISSGISYRIVNR